MVDQDVLPGFEPQPPQAVEVAHVLVDIDLPHLDYPLDYSVPSSLSDSVEYGRVVKVRLSGRQYSGWVVGRETVSVPTRKLNPILSVVSQRPILTPTIYDLAKHIAHRHVATTSQTLSLALPPRHAATEKRFSPQKPPKPMAVMAVPEESLWQSHSGGRALLQHLGSGQTPKAVWTALPPTRDAQLCDAIQATLASQRRVLMIVPTHHDVTYFADLVASVLPTITVGTSSS
ncbi:MAG: primosomal protein N', partial [Actinobacteria bacterium]